jgi:hypothetical protein
METFDLLKVCFAEQKIGKTQVFERFSTLKNGVTSVEEAKCSEVHQQAKQMEMWIELKSLSMKIEEPLSVKLLTC